MSPPVATYTHLSNNTLVQQTRELFDALDRCESILGSSRYLVGDQLTEADVRLFMTLVRFDHVSVADCRGVSGRS